MATASLGVATAATTNATSYTTGAFTPAANDLLVVLVTASDTLAAGSVTNSQGTTFTKINSDVANSIDTTYLFVADSLSSAVSQTCTFDCTGDSAIGASVTVLRISGMTLTGASAVRQSASNHLAASNTPTAVFPSAALTGNLIVGVVGNGANPAALTPPTSFTEYSDNGYLVPTTGHETVARDNGHTSNTVTWGSSSATASAIVIAELDTGAGAAITTGAAFLFLMI